VRVPFGCGVFFFFFFIVTQVLFVSREKVNNLEAFSVNN